MSKHISRRPWVGPKYAGTLILGEAHYGLSRKDDNADATIMLIKLTIAGWKAAFFTKVAQVVTGLPAAEICRDTFWAGVAFHNFVQTSVGGSGKAPTLKQWADGYRNFPDVLRCLEPTHILVLGKRLMVQLPPFDAPPPTSILGGGKVTSPDQVGYYRTGGKALALAMEINHPSWGFSPKAWHPLVRAFLDITATPPVSTS